MAVEEQILPTHNAWCTTPSQLTWFSQRSHKSLSLLIPLNELQVTKGLIPSERCMFWLLRVVRKTCHCALV